MHTACCTRCGNDLGSDANINEDEGYAYCGSCENSYQQSLRDEYPYGQCQECGATGFLHNGSVYFLHIEGGCSQFRFED